MVSNQQLYLAVGIPLLFNATLIGVLIAYINAKFQGMEGKFEARFQGIDEKFRVVDARFEVVDARFGAIDRRFDAMDIRFNDMRDLWRAELHRVEEVLDARLKHLEQARP